MFPRCPLGMTFKPFFLLFAVVNINIDKKYGIIEATFGQSFALSSSAPDIGNLRETFFFNQMRVNHTVFNSSISDFLIDDKTFEIGGKKKGQKQIAEVKEGYVVKDDIEMGFGNAIPLWTFGMNY